MKVHWYEAKRARNPIEHDGVTFEEAATALDDPYALAAEDGTTEGEQRFKLLGKSAAGRVLVVVYTYREHPEGLGSFQRGKPPARPGNDMSSKDPDFKRLKDYDFADAKPVTVFPHLVKLQLEKLHRLNVAIDDDLVNWLTTEVPPEQYAQIMNSALREFRKKGVA